MHTAHLKISTQQIFTLIQIHIFQIQIRFKKQFDQECGTSTVLHLTNTKILKVKHLFKMF